MFNILMMSMFLLILTTIVMMLASFLSKKSINDREKSSPFECGFDPKSSARLPFSLQFFLIAIIFLIFDVEIALILPMILTINLTSFYTWTITSTFFIMILLLGLYHEWNQGALTWAT